VRRVGVVGAGAMGGPVVRHLLAARLEVRVLDPDDEAATRCVSGGAERARTAHDLAAASDVVLVVVASDDDVRTVCTGDAGVLAGARAGTVVVLCSSVRPDTCAAVAAAAPDGVAVLDAAMTGGVRGVEAGIVNLLVGGDAEALAAARPALDPWCRGVHHLGPLGAGQVAKTANNLIHWAQISAIVEALSLVEAYGLSVPAVRAALQQGPTDSRTLRELEQMRLTWHAKDLANARAMAAAVGRSLPLAETVRERMLAITVDDLAGLLAGAGEDVAEGTS
jgi:3-hydroxyisobutyrate dehydrogenase-like beta-hydroxyacid dehydrogenase